MFKDYDALLNSLYVEHAEIFLKTHELNYLFNLFAWGLTHQGSHYWNRIFRGETPLTNNAKAYIRLMLEAKRIADIPF